MRWLDGITEIGRASCREREVKQAAEFFRDILGKVEEFGELEEFAEKMGLDF